MARPKGTTGSKFKKEKLKLEEEKHNIYKQIRYNKAEWEQMEGLLKEHRMSYSGFIRLLTQLFVRIKKSVDKT